MNVKIKRQIQHFWFIKELLQKILTTAERHFSEKTSQLRICRIGVEEFYRSCPQPSNYDKIFCRNSCEKMCSETRCRYKYMYIFIYIYIYIYIYIGIRIKSNCQDIYSSMLRSSECLQLLRRNYYKKVMHII